MYPSASSTAISLRTVALETPSWWRSTRAFEPIGSLGGNVVGDDGAQDVKAAVVRRRHFASSSEPFVLAQAPRTCTMVAYDAHSRRNFQAIGGAMIFKAVRDGKPYPEHRLSPRSWATIPPRQFRLDQLTTVTTVLALDKLLSEDSHFLRGSVLPRREVEGRDLTWRTACTGPCAAPCGTGRSSMPDSRPRRGRPTPGAPSIDQQVAEADSRPAAARHRAPDHRTDHETRRHHWPTGSVGVRD